MKSGARVSKFRRFSFWKEKVDRTRVKGEGRPGRTDFLWSSKGIISRGKEISARFHSFLELVDFHPRLVFIFLLLSNLSTKSKMEFSHLLVYILSIFWVALRVPDKNSDLRTGYDE